MSELEKIYEVGCVSRDEGTSTCHNPEFTMIELYEAYVDYHDIMDLTKSMVRHITQTALGSAKVRYSGEEIDLGSDWKWLHIIDAARKATGISFYSVEAGEEARALARAHDVEITENVKYRHTLDELFRQKAEETLIQPTFTYGHSVETSPLAKKNPGSPRFTGRFELFIVGREHANAFTELDDPTGRRERFETRLVEKEQGNDEAHEVGGDYIETFEYNVPPTGGLGVGADRLVMLSTDSPSIRDTLLLPYMRQK